MYPRVSIIIPCYNHAHFLAHALQSVLDQDFSAWEAIVVDDGSTDNTPTVACQFGDPRIRYFYQENRGLAGARNTGIRAAQTELIALLDADDQWEPKFLGNMVAWLDRHPVAGAVYCGYKFINEQGNEVGKPSLKVISPEKFRNAVIFHGNWLVPCSVVFKKNAAEEVGLFDESLQAVEDTDLWIRMSEKHLFVGLSEVLVKYRRHGSNMTSNPQRMVKAHTQLAEKLFGPAEGNVSSWPTSKKRFYTKLYRAATKHFLAADNIEKSIEYFERLIELSSDETCEMRFWRSVARVHLPAELRNEIGVLDWSRAERDIQKLLDAFEKRSGTSAALKSHIRKMRGCAYIALAREAVEGNQNKLVFLWLEKAVEKNPRLLFSRPYLGTLGRVVHNSWSSKLTEIHS